MKHVTLRDLFTLAYWKNIWHVLIDAFNGFNDDKCMKKSASLAYYTVFSIGPLLMIVIWCIGFFYGEHLQSGSSAQDQVLEEVMVLWTGCNHADPVLSSKDNFRE
jgi:membrane protein